MCNKLQANPEMVRFAYLLSLLAVDQQYNIRRFIPLELCSSVYYGGIDIFSKFQSDLKIVRDCSNEFDYQVAEILVEN